MNRITATRVTRPAVPCECDVLPGEHEYDACRAVAFSPIYLTAHGVPAWDCPDCGKPMHARTLTEWGWKRCRRCTALDNIRQGLVGGWR